MKCLSNKSSNADVVRTMDLIGMMEEPMDEVLLSSVVEACVRLGKPDLLSAQLAKLQDYNKVSINGAHTFGSLIKAYGHVKDIDGAWRCWKEMRPGISGLAASPSVAWSRRLPAMVTRRVHTISS